MFEIRNILNGQTENSRAAMAEIAGGRAILYDLFVEVFGHIPDQSLLSKITGDDFQNIIIGLSPLDNLGRQTARDGA